MNPLCWTCVARGCVNWEFTSLRTTLGNAVVLSCREYLNHFLNFPHSLLVKFLGLYSIKISSEAMVTVLSLAAIIAVHDIFAVSETASPANS